MRIIVVGAGMIGSAIAFRLAQKGAEVILIDAGRVAGGTSFTSGAHINAGNKPPRSYHDLNVRGMQAHVALKDEFGKAPWLHQAGRVEFLAPDKQDLQRTNAERLASWGYRVETLSAAELMEMEPELNPAVIGDAPIYHYPEECQIENVVYCGAMVRKAVKLGTVLREHCEVGDIEIRNGRATGVRTVEGELVEGDVVVNCAGRWSDKVARNGEIAVPLAPTVGFIVYTPSVAVGIGRLIHSPKVRTRPDGGGRLMLRIEAMDRRVAADETASPDMPQAQEIMREAIVLLPRLKGVSPEAVRIAVRPRPSDGHSAVGYMPQVENYYVAITHSGITLSALLGHLVADEIFNGRRDPDLAPFGPGRFFSGEAIGGFVQQPLFSE